ncbi:hypothetical protein Taro_047054 [Colocasia esculenta]|uniref:RING-type domain-containing protein n=1 Tax=Colocasia esculenta TaxID=4460 RepID=A0A843WU63_COLES|nr:hypothetical protein [Colocasia esculenta]
MYDPNVLNFDLAGICIIILCILIVVVGLALIARCTWTSTAPPTVNLSLRTLSFQPGRLEHARYFDCPIFLIDYMEGDQIRVILPCGHRFHVACVDMWLASHPTCPSCHQNLVPGDPAGSADPV